MAFDFMNAENFGFKEVFTWWDVEFQIFTQSPHKKMNFTQA